MSVSILDLDLSHSFDGAPLASNTWLEVDTMSTMPEPVSEVSMVYMGDEFLNGERIYTFGGSTSSGVADGAMNSFSEYGTTWQPHHCGLPMACDVDRSNSLPWVSIWIVHPSCNPHSTLV